MSNTLVRCPFHGDSRPSLNADIEQDVFFCHGCGAKGKLSRYPELQAEVKLVRDDPRPVAVATKPREEVLVPPLEGAPLKYMLSRGFTLDTLDRFEVGGNAEKVWIPVKLKCGECVGFIYRFLEGEIRYLYSKGFTKRNYLFGTKQFEKKNDEVIVTEGSLDCVKLSQLGFRNTVAFLGNQPTETQLGLLRLLGHRVILALDNDKAGRDCIDPLSSRLRTLGHKVFILNYPGKDPGELVNPEGITIEPHLTSLLRVLKFQ